MPNCFQLLDPVSRKPQRFADIDDRMCADFGVTPDEHKYYLGWYDYVGLSLAMGTSFHEIKLRLAKRIREHRTDSDWEREMLRVVTWLARRFISTAWAEIGRR